MEKTVTVYPNEASNTPAESPQQQPQQPAEQQQPLPGSRTIPPPLPGRQSLHRVRLGQFLAERQAAAEAAQAQQTPAQPQTGHSYESLQEEVRQLRADQTLMASHMYTQFQGGQQAQEPQPQDAEEYLDPYDPAQMKTLVQREIQNAFAPHKETLQSAKWQREYNHVLATDGENPNFQPFMSEALKLVAQTGGEVSIPDAYNYVKKESAAQAKANQVQVEQELPETLRRPRRIGDVRFGEIIRHNAETGRARMTGSTKRFIL